jgi:hypothetical protein
VGTVAPPVTPRKRPRFTPRNHPWQPTDEQLLCRDLQHSWSPYTAKRDVDGILRTLHCDRCGSLKHQHLDKEGYIVSTQMSYPPGYLRPGEGRLTREERANLRVRNS